MNKEENKMYDVPIAVNKQKAAKLKKTPIKPTILMINLPKLIRFTDYGARKNFVEHTFSFLKQVSKRNLKFCTIEIPVEIKLPVTAQGHHLIDGTVEGGWRGWQFEVTKLVNVTTDLPIVEFGILYTGKHPTPALITQLFADWSAKANTRITFGFGDS